jgi:hypothetical protein
VSKLFLHRTGLIVGLICVVFALAFWVFEKVTEWAPNPFSWEMKHPGRTLVIGLFLAFVYGFVRAWLKVKIQKDWAPAREKLKEGGAGAFVDVAERAADIYDDAQ